MIGVGRRGWPPSNSLDLVVLDQGVRQKPLAHRRDDRRIGHVELDQPADVDVPDALEPQRRQRALDGLTLRIQDSGLRADQDADPHQPTRSSHAPNDSPASRSYAVTYRSRV